MEDYLFRIWAVSDVGTNFISEKFKYFCRQLSIFHAVSSSYSHQNYGKVEVFIKFVKKTMNTCYKTNADL